MVVRGSPPKPVSPSALERFTDDGNDAACADVRAAAESGHGSLDSHAAYASSPSGVDPSASDAGRSLDLDGRDIGATYTRNGEGQSTSLAGGVSTGAGWASATFAGDGKSTDVSLSVADGWLGGGGGVSWATLDGGATSVSGGLSWYPGGIAVDGTLARTTSDGRTAKLGGMAFFDADRAVTDLGPTGDDDNARRIELRRSTGTSGTLTPGAATALIGFGGRLGIGKERSVVYRTTVDDDRARELITEKKGAVGWLRDKARALGASDDPVTLPDLRAPESLRPGDELVTTVSGRFSGGLFIGGLPLRLGAQGVVQGDFTVGVKRLDDDRLEVVVTPTDVKAVQGRVGAPWLLEADVSRSVSRGLTQAFVFDLKEPGARDAYLKVLDGELPGGLPNKLKGRRREAQELVNALEAETLPAGVQRSFVDQVELKRIQGGVSATFALWFKGGSFPGLGISRASVDEKHTRLDGRGARDTDTRGTERHRQVLLSGDETRGVYASLRRTTTFDDEGRGTSTFGQLALTLQLSDSKVRGRELDDEIIGPLNEHFGLALRPMNRDGRKKSRSVSVSRALDATDLARLATLATTTAGLEPLARQLEGAHDDTARATVVQTFVAKGGLDAMAAIVRALGEPKRTLVVESSAAAYSDPLEKAQELALRYAAPISLSDDNKVLASRFAAVEKALKEATLALADLPHDALLDDEGRSGLTKALEQAKGTLEGLLSSSHLDDKERTALCARLERGWTTGDEQRVLDRLRA